MAHITGGGLTENLPRVLPEGCAAEIDLQSWSIPPLFRLLQQHGAISTDEMFRAFNMGVGLVIVCASRDAAAYRQPAVAGGRTGRVSARVRRRRRAVGAVRLVLVDRGRAFEAVPKQAVYGPLSDA